MESGHVLRKGDSHVPDTSATRALAHAPRTSKRPFHLNSERAAHPDRCAAYFVSSHLGRERPTNMIPEDTLNYNHNGAPINFDDHEARLPHVLRQDGMPTSDGGRHLLLVCPICKHPWYKAGRHEYPRLTPEQLSFLGIVLHADIHALYLLPRALCPLCSTIYLGGMFSVGEYPRRRGYHLLWESASPRRIRLLAMVCRREELTLDTLVHLTPDTPTSSMRDIRAVVAWLETCPFPQATQGYTDEQCAQLAQHCPLGSVSTSCVHRWRGYAWEESCPPLGGEVLVSLAVALPPRAPSPFASLLIGWSALARAMRAVL